MDRAFIVKIEEKKEKKILALFMLCSVITVLKDVLEKLTT